VTVATVPTQFWTSSTAQEPLSPQNRMPGFDIRHKAPRHKTCILKPYRQNMQVGSKLSKPANRQSLATCKATLTKAKTNTNAGKAAQKYTE
jgi:hypothetical protein